jgi:chromosome segregation ATPase
MLLTRNGTVIREAHKLRLELQQATLSNNQSAKKLQGCQVDASRFETQIKELNDVVQKKETLLSEVSEQLKQTKSLFNSVLEEKKSLTQSVTEAQKQKVSIQGRS